MSKYFAIIGLRVTKLSLIALGAANLIYYGFGTSNASPHQTKVNQTMKQEKSELIKRLTPLQFKVTQEDATEPPFKNEYWDNKAPGIYVDIVSGEPLFSSTTKFDSGTGWPSFYEPIKAEKIVEKTDRKFFVKRTEVRSKEAGSHLGHVFNDGPRPTGLRYCINSAALRFIPAADLEKEGFSEFMPLFLPAKK